MSRILFTQRVFNFQGLIDANEVVLMRAAQKSLVPLLLLLLRSAHASLFSLHFPERRHKLDYIFF